MMDKLSRRHFTVLAGSAALGAIGNAVGSTTTARAETPENSSTAQDSTEPPRMYAREMIPRVDAHAHIRVDQFAIAGKLIETMDAGRIAVSVILSGIGQSGNRDAFQQYGQLRQKWDQRLLVCPRDSNPEDGLWWSRAELDAFHKSGYAGTKIWCKYRQGLLAPEIIEKIRYQGELGMPVMGFHIADPPQGNFWKPNYWESIREAEKLIRMCPDTTFIMAHGFWLMNENRGLDVLADYFHRNSNLYVDLSAVFQWWDPPAPDHAKLREFMISFKDRLLFATDGNPEYTTSERLASIYRLLETDDDRLQGFFKGDATNDYMIGLDLPDDVLNYVYYWNAARLVPEVRKSLSHLGYDVVP